MIYILVRIYSAYERVIVCGAVTERKQANFWNAAQHCNAYYAVPVDKTPILEGYDLIPEVEQDL